MQSYSTILFVDDEQHEAKYFKRAFNSIFNIETANSVESAIEILEQMHDQIAVVITDQRMPKRPGLELLQFTHKKYPRIVRMLTTAFCDMESAIEAINNAEVFRYIPKPWDLDQLENSIKQALTRFQSGQGADNSRETNSLLKELDDDCRHWLMYSLHAYGDSNVYQSGLEAIACRYYVDIREHYPQAEHKALMKKVDELIQNEYLNETVLEELDLQKDKGFGIIKQTPGKPH